jgi:hypothetical protein
MNGGKVSRINRAIQIMETFYKETKWFVRNAGSRSERRKYKRARSKLMRQQAKQEMKDV